MAYSGVASVYKTTDGPCDENDELQSHGSSERIDRLLNAEAAMLDAGGNVVRLVGLYHKTRGPHTFFIQKGTVERNGESVVNMIHYEDAARLLLAVSYPRAYTIWQPLFEIHAAHMRSFNQGVRSRSKACFVPIYFRIVKTATTHKVYSRIGRGRQSSVVWPLQVLQGDGSDSEFYRGQAFTGSDNKPLTFRKMMDAVAESGVLEGSVDFTGTDKPSGKLMDSSQTDERLGFAPKYGSFDSFFLENKGADFYHDD